MFYLSAKHSQNNHLKLGHAVTFILYLAHVASLIFQPKNLTQNFINVAETDSAGG